MQLTEPEIQVLASLAKADLEATPTDKASLEKSGARFWLFREDWSDAYGGLTEKGLIDGDGYSFRLTDAGRPIALQYHRQRPDRFWYFYQRFYPAAYASAAHSRLCERVFGRDLCQDGMTDMQQLEDLLDLLGLGRGDHVLDLGCGAGLIAEYISDETGAHVTGLDYSAPAVTLANKRTAEKRSRLSFIEGDMNALDLPERAFDAVISLDTLYWVADLAETLTQVARAMKSGGQAGLFMLQGLQDGDPSDLLRPDGTELAQALAALDLGYHVYDYTARNAAFWRQNWQAARDLRDDFAAEGNDFIAANIIEDAEGEFLPEIEAGTLKRYLYHVRF